MTAPSSARWALSQNGKAASVCWFEQERFGVLENDGGLFGKMFDGFGRPVLRELQIFGLAEGNLPAKLPDLNVVGIFLDEFVE